MFTALLTLAAAASYAPPLPPAELIARSQRVCQASMGAAADAAIQKKYGNGSETASLRTQASMALFNAAVQAEGIPPQQLDLTKGVCLAFLEGKLEAAHTKTFDLPLRWRYPDGHTVPLQEYLDNLPVAQD